MSTSERMSSHPSSAATTRDQFDKIASVVRRALRYWWVAGLVLVLGATLSVVFALVRQPVYESTTVLLHREMIPTEALRGRAEASYTRNPAGQYREMAMARKQLRRVIEELRLYPEVVEGHGTEAAVDEMREHLDFRDRGGGTFQIAFRDGDPERAQQVVARLTELLLKEDERVRREQASVTRDFLEAEKSRAADELRDRQRRIAEFLSENPEFAQETITMTMPGASIRAQSARMEREEDDPNLGPELRALHRQRARIQERLENPDRPAPAAQTPERLAAEARVRAARGDLESAKNSLEEKLTQGLTDRHPDVARARSRVEQAEKRLAEAEGAVPTDEEAVAASKIDPDKLRAELRKVEKQIREERSQSRRRSGAEAEQESAEEDNWVVRLETQWAALTRELEEARERVEALESKVFAAEITASSEMAEQSGKISVIDPPHVPERPIGKGKRIIVMAGTALFGMLALAVAFGLALIDDRVYTRYDLEQLELAPVLTVVPEKKQRRLFRKNPPALPGDHQGGPSDADSPPHRS